LKERPDVAADYASSLQLTPAAAGAAALWNGLIRTSIAVNLKPADAGPNWVLTAFRDDGAGNHVRLDPAAVQDMYLVVNYTV
jgi:hypothetical protein